MHTFLPDCDSLVTRLQKVHVWFAGSATRAGRRGHAVTGVRGRPVRRAQVDVLPLSHSSLPHTSDFFSVDFNHLFFVIKHKVK